MFISCFYMVIMRFCDKTRIVYELQSHLTFFLYGLPTTMATKNEQSVISRYITLVMAHYIIDKLTPMSKYKKYTRL